MTLEDTIVARLDALVAAVSELHADVKAIQKALQEPQEPILEPVDAGWQCEWPDCGIALQIEDVERSTWSKKALCREHNAILHQIRTRKKQVAA